MRMVTTVAAMAVLLFGGVLGRDLTTADQSMSGAAGPRIEQRAGGHVLVLPDAMTKTLKKLDRDFVPWTDDDYIPSLVKTYRFSAQESPFAVIGDFNGDGALDVAIQGHDPHALLIVAVLSKDKGYVGVEVERRQVPDDPKLVPRQDWRDVGETEVEHGLSAALALQRPAYFQDPPEVPEKMRQPPLDLKTDAIGVFVFDKDGALYYFDGRVFRYYALGC